MLTIFTIPKPFRGHFGVIQRNALTALTKLSPRPDIILFGDEEGAAEVANVLGIRHVPEVARNEFGTPIISDFFAKAQQLSPHPVLCYINADIILMNDFLAAVQNVAAKKRRFMLAGQRWDLDVTEPLNFDGDWQQTLHERTHGNGSLHNITGMDYFAFSKEIADDIPPMAIGRAMWDNWFLYHARARGAMLVDASAAVTVVHQNHDYSHVAGGKPTSYKGPEVERNKELAGGMDHYFTLRDATHQLTADGKLRRFTDRWHVRRWFLTLPILRPALGFPVRVVLKTIEMTYPLRARLGMKLAEPEDRGQKAEVRNQEAESKS
jgi:hypothetical protein